MQKHKTTLSNNCPFCNYDQFILDQELSFAKWDGYPVSNGHALIIPKRHFSSYFESTEEERKELWEVVEEVKVLIDEKHSPDGYNIGINIGEAAGQTVQHLHIHVIPRYSGDMADARGGVRGVIPDKQKY